MARKKGTKPETETEPTKLEEIVEVIEQRVNKDRDRLSEYLDRLINAVDTVNDPLTTVGAADAVAKIGDSLTRQTHLTVEALKVIARRTPQSKDDKAGAFQEIGLPFEDDIPKDGSN